MFLDWTNWTFWVTAIALVAFGFCLRDIYEQWRFRKARKNVRDELREVDDLTRLLQAATERLNKLNEPAGAALRALIRINNGRQTCCRTERLAASRCVVRELTD
jgi:hypothetical protein